MSETFVKEELGTNFSKGIRTYNNTNKEPAKEYNPHSVNQKLENEDVELDVKEDIEIKEEPLEIPDVNRMVKGSIGVGNRELMDFVTETHSSDKPYQCSHCAKIFSKKYHLTRHMSIHTGNKPYQCNQCDKAFSRSGVLKIHMRTHTGDKPYTCSQCDKSFSEKTYLTKHLKVHARKQALTNHIKIHTGDTPCQCSQCDKAFINKPDLPEQLRTHTGEKLHQCFICEKAFSHNGNLISHMRIHTEAKPYQWTQCEKAFFLNIHLEKHLRKHAGEKKQPILIMSGSFVKEKLGDNFSKGICTHNNANKNKEIIKVEDNTDPGKENNLHSVFQSLENEYVEPNFNEKIEIKEEPLEIPDVECMVKGS